MKSSFRCRRSLVRRRSQCRERLRQIVNHHPYLGRRTPVGRVQHMNSTQIDHRAIQFQRDRQLAAWDTAPFAHDCHPPGDEEHLIPLLVAAGAAQESAGQRVYSEQVMKTTISAFRFG